VAVYVCIPDEHRAFLRLACSKRYGYLGTERDNDWIQALSRYACERLPRSKLLPPEWRAKRGQSVGEQKKDLLVWASKWENLTLVYASLERSDLAAHMRALLPKGLTMEARLRSADERLADPVDDLITWLAAVALDDHDHRFNDEMWRAAVAADSSGGGGGDGDTGNSGSSDEGDADVDDDSDGGNGDESDDNSEEGMP
jgi:hypothetical protein